MADANLDAIVGALPDLAGSIDTLVGELAQTPPEDPRAQEIVSQIQEMTAKVKQAAATIAPSAPVTPAAPAGTVTPASPLSPTQTPTGPLTPGAGDPPTS